MFTDLKLIVSDPFMLGGISCFTIGYAIAAWALFVK